MGDYIDNKNYKYITSSNSYNLSEYKYPSSIIYMVNKDIKNWSLTPNDPFLNQRNFVSLATRISLPVLQVSAWNR